MITVIVTGVLFAVAGWIFAGLALDEGLFGKFFFMLFCTAGGAAIGLCIALGIGARTEPVVKEVGREEIVLMTDGTTAEGRFSLFGGVMQESPSFSYYTKTNGALTLKSQKASHSAIYEDSKKPYVVTFCEEESHSAGWYFTSGRDWNCSYIFHVPEGSVSPGIKLDAGG